ncbi:unnamed protein product [Phytophthora lilii]|uniref:Unnamed protein product n=1 Tax=Phytophthora lilii TaxID=2077276 RepID=A0A9W6WUJ0_9STRA|nr:unnamed protein product [Phytophthora lilii]
MEEEGEEMVEDVADHDPKIDCVQNRIATKGLLLLVQSTAPIIVVFGGFAAEYEENTERKRSKKGGRGGRQSDEAPVFTLSDISSDEETAKPFPPSLSVPLGPPTSAQAMTVRESDTGMDEIRFQTQVIDLASDTESE